MRSRRHYLTSRRLAELERSLSERDRAVLNTLARVRVATAQQLRRMHFENLSRRQTRQALASLTGRQLIVRLPRAVGGVRAGSDGYTYSLDIAGQRLLRPTAARPQRPWSVGLPFLAHSLAITETYVQLVETERAGRLQIVEFVTEPGCWRRFYGPGGARAVLKPDAFVVVKLGPYEDRWLLEIDRGTEAATTLDRKLTVYRRYWQSGTEQARTGVFPLVLWAVPDVQRHEVLVDVVGRQPTEAWPLFRVALFDDVLARLLEGAGS